MTSLSFGSRFTQEETTVTCFTSRAYQTWTYCVVGFRFETDLRAC